MKFSEPSEDIKKNMVKVLEKNFNCPPWNDRHDDGCKEAPFMKMFNAAGQAVYFNQIFKNGKTQYVVKALSGQHIKGRDGQRHASRSFTELHQAEAFLARNGYKSSSR